MAPRHRGMRGPNYGVLMLAAHVMNFGLEYIPPGTLALLAGQAAIFLDLLPQFFRSANSVCMSSYLVYHQQDWRRLILSQFYHGDDMHLYFNMVSLLYKGTFLERKFGTRYFLYLITVFTALTGATYVGLGSLLSEMLGNQGYLTSCAVGFSGVLFAMKVLTTHYLPRGTQYLFGMIPVPSKYIFWAELILIQLMTPNASFVGHLAGILVGLAYIYGPLKHLMHLFMSPDDSSVDDTRSRRPRRRGSSSSEDERRTESQQSLFSAIFRRSSANLNQSAQPGYRTGGSGTWGGAPYDGRATPSAPPDPGQAPGGLGFESYNNNYGGHVPPYGSDYDRYTGGLDEEEQYRRAMEESLRERNHQPGLYPDLDDLRNRRANFYQ